MKKYITVIAILFIFSIILMACSNDSEEEAAGEEDIAEGTENNEPSNDEDLEDNDTQDEAADEEEALEENQSDNNQSNMDIDIASVYASIVENELLSEDAMDMENSALDWHVTELAGYSNKSIKFHEDKAFFTYNMGMYAIDMEDITYSEEIDVATGAQMHSYEDNLVFLQTRNEKIYLHFLNPESETVTDTIEHDLKKETDSISNTFLHESKLVGITGLTGDIYIFDLPGKSLDNVISMEALLGEKRDINTLGFDEGLLYMGTMGLHSSLYAFDADTGELAWELVLGEEDIYAHVDTYPREAVFIEDSMHVLLDSKEYVEINKSTGEVLNAAPFGPTAHLLEVTKENIFMAHENVHEDKEYIVSLDKETFDPNWAVAVDGEHRDFSAAVHDGYLYTGVLNQALDSHGTDWYKIDMNTGEVLEKDVIEALSNQNFEGLFFEIYHDKMFLSDGKTLAITPVK